ncbi:arginine--tRNA ligase [Mycoplasma corogypsi]|uniref:arginine--tRNA ligase n=1 Tax=Mycoplasma corogypsi TaxID=2106 RepID=UPI003872DA75
MSLKQTIKNEIINGVKKLQNEGFFDAEFNVDDLVINLTEPNVPEKANPNNILFDYSTNAPFLLKNYKKVAPIVIAEKLKEILIDSEYIKDIMCSMPGFINIVLSYLSFIKVIDEVNRKQDKYGANVVKPEQINLEYISANPTGFLHVGHVRGACFGDALAKIYKHAGHNLETEYYVNDAGNQINVLADSAHVRYLELFGVEATMPEDCYRGNDIVWAAQKIKDLYDDKFIDLSIYGLREEFKEAAVKVLLFKIKHDLSRLNISLDRYSSEKDIYNNNLIEPVLEKLKPHTYVKDGALWLNTTEFGDDKDRVLVKNDGSSTYLLPDIAYHEQKFSRAKKLINIWGADHSGYIARMKIAMQCLGHNPNDLDVLTIQLVRLIKDGQEFKMSKRAGTSVTLEDLLEVASPDAIRFTLLTREINSKFDFDIDLANSTDSNNPVFIVQYAHSRTVSLINRLKEAKKGEFELTAKAKKVVVMLDEFTELIQTIVSTNKVNLMSQYLINLAKAFNSFYSETKLIGHDNESEYAYLVKAVQIVLQLGLKLIGVSAPESM